MNNDKMNDILTKYAKLENSNEKKVKNFESQVN